MHEMSIAQSVIELAEKEAINAGANKIIDIELDVGTLSGVELHALEFAFQAVVEGTLLEESEIKINVIKAQGKCNDCNNVFEMNQIYDSCPGCSSFNVTLLKGKELKLKSLNVE